MKKWSNGFLIAQLMIAFLLLAILMTLTMSTTSSISYFLLKAELEKMHALFFYMQQQAMGSNSEHTILFDRIAHTYRTSTGRVEQLSPHVRFDFVPESAGPPSQPIALIDHPITFVQQTVIFYPDGTISSGTVYLTDEKRIMMGALTSGIGQLTYIRKYRYQVHNRKWILLT